jgi:mannan endo-1,4-beta-mannosidase
MTAHMGFTMPLIHRKKMLLICCLFMMVTIQCRKKSPTQPGVQPPKYATFKVEGRHLVDPYGEKVVLRGVNAMIIYWDKLGSVTYPEIAKTGANAVRIFWTDDPVANAVDLDGTLLTCERNHMIPLPGVWMATGKWDQLGACVDFWCRPDIAAVVKKHEKTVLVNIANEAGDGSVTDAQYRAGYEDAVSRIRGAGIRSPLVIDAAGWGRGEKYIFDNAQYLINRDPEHNLIFSWHPWDPITWKGTKTRIKAAIDSAVAKNIPFIIGEFSRSEQADSRSATTPIEWRTIMEYGHLNEIGWLPWVWWCCEEPNDGHSLTRDKIYGHWANAPWGEEVAVTGAYSIQNTAVRPASMK